MSAKIGPLLARALSSLEAVEGPAGENRRLVLETQIGVECESGRLPVVAQFKIAKPKSGEIWEEYKHRISKPLDDSAKGISSSFSGPTEPIYSAGAVRTAVSSEQVDPMTRIKGLHSIELDPTVLVTTMDDAIVDVERSRFHNNHGPLTGQGIKVAVLDSGIDAEHPFLNVADTISTSGESVDIPGSHGTHCAGSIASQDPVFPGVAPEVELINVKVLRSDGRGSHTAIAKGVDEALDRSADILSMSLGFNHLPTWSNGGHGWSCPDGRCPLCTSVDTAVALGAVVVVAAGNEHERAEALRDMGLGAEFDTELSCPGQSRSAITVGALTKRTFLPASFSSRGPTAYGQVKPNLAGPGVNITSTVPVPRNAQAQPIPDPPRSTLFGRESGTSMATPIVAGAAALILQYRRQEGMSTKPRAIRKDLLELATQSMHLPDNVVGTGRLNLGLYRAIIS